MFLGENHLTGVEGLEVFQRLSLLNLDRNQIRTLDHASLPPSLHTLSLSNNLLNQFPWEFLESGSRVSWLYLRDNFINTIPLYNFKNRKKIDKLDLGENSIGQVSQVLFNGTLQVRDLNLELNKLVSVRGGVFKGTELGRVYLSQNRLKSISDETFIGVEDTLEYLDLGGNQLQIVPKALARLRKLKYLYIPSNNISRIDNDTFDNFSSTLSALSLSDNRLEAVPFEALAACKKLSHLNMGYNHIMQITEEDFIGLESLDTLLLMNNRIVELHPNTFRQTPKLRELSLSFNKISAIDLEAFTDVQDSLESLEVSFGLYQEEFPEIYLKPLKSLVWSSLYTFKNLQYLNLDGNRITHIPGGVFHSNIHKELKDIRISYNHLSIPRDAFQNTKLERVDLSNNDFVVVPSGALGEVGFTLRLLDVSYNQIEHVDATMFPETPLLTGLNLCYNKLTTLADNVFDPLTGLLRLELCGNRLRTNYKALLNRLSSLRELNLGEVGLRSLPALPQLRHLVSLNLSSNALTDLSVGAIMSITNLRTLLLSKCRLAAVPQVWTRLPLLKHLDLTYNPLRVSFTYFPFKFRYKNILIQNLVT
ncbi:hypothetical protein O3M35_004866 [Rhynocoris fuscipes]|uniref:Toll-like receptor 2 n=1 Tax=Rhynocoris fuscipes TaxID=488301 RepID=A0AAW1DHU5_9HEMI